jgi:ubiquinone/menaquinone biosynthesis C-methylase UbiE
MSAEKAQVVATYTAAADHYDDAAEAFWGYFGRRTVERLRLPAGARILDACCGTGTAALPAAETVGTTGFVLGVDLTPALLAKAEARARRRALHHLRFVCADLESGAPSRAAFDAVTCVFGIFFLPDMAAMLRRLWESVRPGGAVAVTTWGRTVLEPVSSVFWERVRQERPDLHRAFEPWERIATTKDLAALFASAGIPDAETETEARAVPLTSPEAFWDVILGSGYRGTLERMDPKERERVRLGVLEKLRRDRASALEMEVVYGTAHKPEP